MLELIGLAATGAATVLGYLKTRGFVRNRLAYVSAVQKSTAPVVAGAAAAVVAMPVVAILPVVGGMTAMLFGAAVGLGFAAGAKDVRQRRLPW